MKIKNIYIKKEKALKDIDICFEKNNKIFYSKYFFSGLNFCCF